MNSVQLVYQTPHGTGRIVQRRASHPWAALVLTHGAGGGVESHELAEISRQLPGRGISVALVEMPWRYAGKKVAPAPRVLDESFRSLANRLRPRNPMFVGGRSAGARVACRTGRGLGAVGVVALSFPLHPPGRPERSRAEELRGARLPTLVVQGSRDAFGTPTEFPVGTTFGVVPDADHALLVPARAELSQQQATQFVVDRVYDWIRRRRGREQ